MNYIEENRDICNLPKELLESCVTNSSTYSLNSRIIEDPYEHAIANYSGPFVCTEWYNEWGPYMSFYTTGQGLALGWDNCCVPTAITNIILAVKNRYPALISIPEADDLFDSIAYYGTQWLCGGTKPNEPLYNPSIGSQHAYAYKYINNACSLYSIYTGISSSDLYENSTYWVTENLKDGYLLLMNLFDHDIYSGETGHAVLCFAYTVLRSQSTGWYKTYLKIADGWGNSARYIDLANSNYETNLKNDHYRVRFYL